MSETKDRLTQELCTKHSFNIDEIIAGGLPLFFDVHKLHRFRINSTGIEIFTYDGKPFLEIHPMQFTSEFDNKGNCKVKVTTLYRYLEPVPPHRELAEQEGDRQHDEHGTERNDGQDDRPVDQSV